MSEPPEEAPATRHATWVALRTLRQRPKVVDHRENGEPIYEVRSVRLVLRGDADHFNRLAQCSKCGREVPGAPVLTPADLDRPVNSVICKDCVRAAALSAPWQPPSPPAERPPTRPAAVGGKSEAEPSLAPAPSSEGEPVAPAASALVDERLAAVETRLDAALARMAELAQVQASESFELRRVAESTESRLHAELVEAVAAVGAEVTSSSAAGAGRLAALEDHVQQSLTSAAELVAGQRSELAAIGRALAEVDTRIGQLSGSTRDVDGVDGTLERRLAAAEARLAAQPTAEQVSEAVDHGMALAQSGMVRSSDAHEAEQRVALAIDELRQDRDQLQQRLDSLVQHALETEMRINGLAASVEAGAARLDALERRLGEAMDRMDAFARSRSGPAEAVGAGRRPAAAGPPAGAATTGDLVDALERQLRQAEGRLAQVAMHGSQVD